MDVTPTRRTFTLMGVLACSAVTLGLLCITERSPLLAVLITASIASFVAFLSRRPLFASVTTLGMVSGIYLVSSTKKMAMGMALHSYDLLFYFNLPTFAFLWDLYRSYVIAAMAFAVLALATIALSWRLDRLRCPRTVSGALLMSMVAGSVWAKPQAIAVQRPNIIMNVRFADYLSLFYMSWPSTFAMLRNHGTLAADAHTDLPDFAATPACTPEIKPPHIVLIHQESLFPPSIYPQLDYDHALDRFFQSDDGRVHKLRVEVLGGGSWITEFSIMSGISSRSFGDMAPFLHILLRGRLREALPLWLERCGYRSVVFFPSEGDVFSLDKFYDAIGLHEVIDREAQGASFRERDRFYFDHALTLMEQRIEPGGNPLFIYVQTMVAHGPFGQPFLPDEHVPGPGKDNPPQVNEYLHRMGLAAEDGAYLVDELKRRFPGERFVIVRFGDHQPDLTDNVAVSPVLASHPGGDQTQAFLTYYSVLGINYPLPPLPDYDVLDIPFLQTVILDAAGLPLTPAQQERKRLMAVCAGRYFGCNDILAFHRRLIDSGIVTP